MDISHIYSSIDNGQYADALDKLYQLNEKNPTTITLECLIHREMGNYNKSLDVINQLLDNESYSIHEDEINENGLPVISINYLKSKIEQIYTLWRLGEHKTALDHINSILEILSKTDQTKKIQPSIAALYKIKGNILANLGNFGESLECHKKSVDLYETLNNVQDLALIYNNIGYTYFLLGEINFAEEYLLKSIKLGESTKLQDYARSLTNYGILLIQKGEYSEAHGHLRKALDVQKSIDNKSETAYTLFELISLMILMDNQDGARIFIDQLRNEFEQSPNNYVSLLYQLSNAIIKKSVKKFETKIEARNILRSIINNRPDPTYYYVLAMKLLCELLLEEMQIYENEEILDEINSLVEKLESLGRKEESSLVLHETMLLKSKLFLIENRVSDAIDVLLDSLKVAEDKGLTQIATHISHVYNDLKYQLTFWEELDQRNASLKERIDYSDIIGLVKPLESKSMVYKIMQNETPILLLILNQGGLVKFMYKFSAVEDMQEHLIGGFLSAINSFFSSVFKETNSLDRIKSRDHTILMKSQDELLYCYIFRGQSLFATQRLEDFVQNVKSKKDITDQLSSLIDIADPNVTDSYNITTIIDSIFTSGL